MAKENWTREQTIIALNLYCKIPFNRVASNHPEIIRIGAIIGRSPNSVKMKIGNFGSFDPELKKKGIVGLANSSKLDEEIWNEFNNDWERLGYESEILISTFAKQPIELSSGIDLNSIPEGKEREATIKQRINQNFFRSTILSSYNFKCCVTGLSIVELLTACHIVPWSQDKANRLNPRNGICLNELLHKAFDGGFITITTDYKISVSKYLDEFKKEDAAVNLILKYNNNSIILPDKFMPSKEFLEYHNRNKFIK